MKEMKHPNILGIDFVRQESYYIYLILPFSDGGDLDKCFKEKVRADEKNNRKGVDLTEEQILFWALKIIAAVGYFHSKKIVHRDLKMANILIEKNSDLKVCDFGLAYQFKTDGETENKSCGTPTTMAPEVINSKPYRMMPDWWSVGIILYQFMNHVTPFQNPPFENKPGLSDNEKEEQRKKQIKELYDRACNRAIEWDEAAKKYSPELIDLVKRLLDRDPKTRIGSKDSSKEILAHAVFKPEFVERVAKGGYKPQIVPACFDFDQDFDLASNKLKIDKAMDCFTPEDKNKIDGNKDKF